MADNFDDIQAAPLLCAGIIGSRCLRPTGLTENECNGARLGLYGFGAVGHVCTQLARVARKFTSALGTVNDIKCWLTNSAPGGWAILRDEPPVQLHASIIFAPAGELAPVGLKAMRKGGTVVLGGIRMSPIPSFDYSLIYGERVARIASL